MSTYEATFAILLGACIVVPALCSLFGRRDVYWYQDDKKEGGE